MRFIWSLLTVCHRVVMTDEISREWRRHQSAFATSWLAAMRRRRKVVEVIVDQQQYETLLATIRDSDLAVGQRAAAEKDCLLVTGAWAAVGWSPPMTIGSGRFSAY
jgi:hypothetical protein